MRLFRKYRIRRLERQIDKLRRQYSTILTLRNMSKSATILKLSAAADKIRDRLVELATKKAQLEK